MIKFALSVQNLMVKGITNDFDIFFKKHLFPSWICESDSLEILEVNDAAVEFFGYSNGDFTKLSLNDLFAEKESVRPEVKLTYEQVSFCSAGGMVTSGPLTIRRDVRNSIPINIFTIGLFSNDHAHVSRLLVKEIHHRVKNNLQLISSIIYFKSISVDSPDFRSFLDNMRQRIKSVALIHERLLQSENLNNVEISDYLGKLIVDIKASQQTSEKDISISANITPQLLPLDTAIFCGLIVNEVVTNSLKHAFIDQSVGAIDLLFEKSERFYYLKISDNGISLPEEIVPGETESFGMQMLSVFTKQINGKLELNRHKGTSYVLQFPSH